MADLTQEEIDDLLASDAEPIDKNEFNDSDTTPLQYRDLVPETQPAIVAPQVESPPGVTGRGQLVQPAVMPPMVPPAPDFAVAAPGAAPVMAPRPPRPVQFQSPEELEQLRRIGYQFQGQPLADAERAISTAMKFQGIRGYQRDMENGASSSEALAKWAPIMFAQPKAATLGQAGTMVRASRPPQTKYMDVGGTLYQMTPDGRVTALSGQKEQRLDPNDPDVQLYKSLLTDIRRKQADIDKGGALREPADEAADFKQLQIMQGAADEVSARIKARTGTRRQIQSPNRAGGGRIKVRHPDGRFGTVSASQLDAAIARGYTRVP